jgi:hypothetical protein
MDSIPKLPTVAISFYSLPPTLPLSVACIMFMFFEAIPFKIEKDPDAEEIERITVVGGELFEEDIECKYF